MLRKQRLCDNSPFLFQYLLFILDLGLLTYVVKVTNVIVKMSCFTLYLLYWLEASFGRLHVIGLVWHLASSQNWFTGHNQQWCGVENCRSPIQCPLSSEMYCFTIGQCGRIHSILNHQLLDSVKLYKHIKSLCQFSIDVWTVFVSTFIISSVKSKVYVICSYENISSQYWSG